ncbi:MAG TPA: 5-formyltetrahydrofolate cyclo-ligase, partial [Acidimicrobiia bacterium]|nr:5-formyltetrahydrofolate cyclo-ligase [Acidimicrobiia bacterium]
MSGQPAPDASKADWRAWSRAVRSGLAMEMVGDAITDAIRRWGVIRPGTRVLAFDALADEPDVTGVAADGIPLLTRTPPAGDLTLHRADGRLERHALGFRQPVADAPEVTAEEVDLVLVPGLVFDRSGGRIGRGSAYFDR